LTSNLIDGGNLVSCRAALATLRFHQEHRLGARSRDLGERLQARLRRLQGRHPVVAEVRGLGLMVGAELRDDSGPAAARTDAVLEHMKDAGYLIGKTGVGRNVLTFMPPLVVAAGDLDAMVDELDRTFADTA
jgi:4-aminobutyrate aminotransferase-like enzyme